MKGNYQKILLLATIVYIGNCLPICKARESEETIPAMNRIYYLDFVQLDKYFAFRMYV